MSVLGSPSILLLFSRIDQDWLFWLFWIPWFPSEFYLQFSNFYKKKKTCWIFDRDSVESVNQFGHIYHLNNVNLPTHEHFPFTYIFFNFFHWCFVVFGIQVLNLLNLFLSILLFLMLLQMELLFSFHSGLSNASV